MPDKTSDSRAPDECHASDLPRGDPAEPWDENEAGEDKPDEDAVARAWWAQLPDFIKPDYPFDLQPDRLPFAQRMFSLVGAPQHCPAGACRRA